MCVGIERSISHGMCDWIETSWSLECVLGSSDLMSQVCVRFERCASTLSLRRTLCLADPEGDREIWELHLPGSDHDTDQDVRAESVAAPLCG